jgi:transposase
MKERGYECAVIAPTQVPRSAKGANRKTDKRDAGDVYEIVRAHVLAGNRLYNIWVPDMEIRDDRDMVRTSFDISQKITKAKIQILALLKKNGVEKPSDIENWTKTFYSWMTEKKMEQGYGFQVNLRSLLNQLEFLEIEKKNIDMEILKLAMKDRYCIPCKKLMEIRGVGLKTAMIFLTEIGDMNRFENRRKFGAYIGLTPKSHESGDSDDRKGRITREGPFRLRSVLNQAVWVHLRFNGTEKDFYDKIVARNPKRKKKAVVACMRRLGIRMWHTALNAANENIFSSVA